jgi:hypothetical protein
MFDSLEGMGPRFLTLIQCFDGLDAYQSGTIDGESSSLRSRSICVLKLGGNSGSSGSNALSLSPISRVIARQCLWSRSM